jgi:predicted nucleic acid-binding protein
MEARAVVVDASVAIKWILPEEGHEQAATLLRGYHAAGMNLLAPHLLISEVGNALWKHVQRGELTSRDARRSFAEFLLNCPSLVDSHHVSRSSLELAVAHDCAYYDCLYLALALDVQCDMVTADERFFRQMRAAFSCVRLLAEFE